MNLVERVKKVGNSSLIVPLTRSYLNDAKKFAKNAFSWRGFATLTTAAYLTVAPLAASAFANETSEDKQQQTEGGKDDDDDLLWILLGAGLLIWALGPNGEEHPIAQPPNEPPGPHPEFNQEYEALFGDRFSNNPNFWNDYQQRDIQARMQAIGVNNYIVLPLNGFNGNGNNIDNERWFIGASPNRIGLEYEVLNSRNSGVRAGVGTDGAVGAMVQYNF